MRKLLATALILALSPLMVAQTTTALMPYPHIQFFTSSGVPLSGGKIFSYAAGTTTPLPTYSDSTGSTQNPNPIILDAGGFPPNGTGIWLGNQNYKILAQDSNGVQQWVVDNVSDIGLVLKNFAVVTNPVGAAVQTIVGPLSTGNYGITAGTFTGAMVGTSYNVTHVMCDTQAGASADQKIAACITAVAALGGGVADARGITGAQSWAATVSLTGADITLLLGEAQFTMTNAARPAISVIGSNVGGYILKIKGLGADPNNGSSFIAGGSAAGDVIQLGDGTNAHIPFKAEVSGIYINGNNTLGCMALNAASSTWIWGNHFINCTGHQVSLLASLNNLIGPQNYFDTMQSASAVGALVLNNARGTTIWRNNIAPVNAPGLRTTGVASNSISSRNNDYSSSTYAFQFPTLAAVASGFTSENDQVEFATPGWADIGSIADGGSNAPSGIGFKALTVASSSGATTLTAAGSLTIEDSLIGPATTIASGVAVTLRNNTWSAGLTNNATTQSDLSAGLLNVGGLSYSGSSNASSGPRTASSGSGSGWTNPGNVANTTLATQIITTGSTGTTNYLLGTGFTFAIPSGASILGIQVTLVRKVSVTAGFAVQTAASNGICMDKASVAIGSCKPGTAAWTNNAFTETWGGANDLWGATWTPTDINAAGFGFQVAADYNNTSGANQTISLGSYKISVYYASGGTLMVGSQTINGPSSLGGPGYSYLPSGALLEWGLSGAVANGGTLAITLPLACPNSLASVTITPAAAGSGTQAHDFVNTVTTTGFTINNAGGASNTFYWQVMCY